MENEFSKDAIYARVYKEIHRRSEAQEKALQFNLIFLGVLFGWLFTYGYPRDPVVFAIAAVANFLFGLKWLSEDKNLAGLYQYLREQGAPLETWQKGKFYTLYPTILRLQDAIWRVTAFLLPGGAMLGVLIGDLLISPKHANFHTVGIGLIALICMILVTYGFIELWWPWRMPERED